jgi:radical SAM protein with 4Fe4S-binding SPASM domain
MILPKNNKNDNDIILANYFKELYFDNWGNNNDNKTRKKEFEMMINAKCNLKCKYCYYNTFNDELYPDHIDESNILNNVDNLLEYFNKNNMSPKINIFSGEPFEQDISFSIINKILDFYSKSPNNNMLAIPTNFSFINSDEKTKIIEQIITKAKNNNIEFMLSCSIDGKYCDKNRPYKSGYIRDDEWYNKVFKFCKKYNFGFHPMIYFNEIQNWHKNFLWFEKMSKKYNLKDDYLFLLEVRNIGWDKKSIQHIYDFYKFVTMYIFNKHKHKNNTIVDIIDNKCDYNLLSIFTINPNNRALSCAYESSLAVRMADMKIFPCHRLQYPQFETGSLYFNNNDILIESKNIEMYITSNHLLQKKSPVCEKCAINEICFHGCLGSQFETMKDPFIPIPNVCAMEHAKTTGIIDGIYELKKENELYQFLNKKKINQIKLIGERK